MAGLGEELRAAREARSLTLSDVSERIHIRTVYLQNLEDEDWRAIAAPVYVRGFLRTYARFLGLEPEQAVARFNATLPPSGYQPLDRSVGAEPRRGPSLWLWLVGGAAIVLVAYVAYNYIDLQRNQRAGPSVGAVQASAIPSEAPTALPAGRESKAALPVPPHPKASISPVPAAEANSLSVQLVEPSWLRVTVDGAVALEGTFPTGTLRAFHGKTVTVRAGNAAGVAVTAGGHSLGTLGGPGTVVDRTFRLGQE